MDRRKFLYRSSGLMAGGFFLNFAPLKILGRPLPPDVCLVTSENYFFATQLAVKELGGIREFVPEGASVGFLVNSQFDEPGTYPHPDIALAMVSLCRQAGASEITMLQPVFRKYWKRSEKYHEYEQMIDELSEVSSNNFPAEYNEQDFMIIPEIQGAVHLKDIEIVRKIEEIDVLINIPILKHHSGTLFTGALKNMMGLTTRKTNVTFHLGSGTRNEPEYLGQCIADINLVRKPDLVVADAIEFITANGPTGPGPMKKLNKVVASRDPVAVDALGAAYIDLDPGDVISIKRSFEMGIGEMDLSSLNFVDIKA